MLCPSAIKRLWGSRDYSADTQEMLQESTELQDVKVHSVAELLVSPSMRWTLIGMAVLFASMQLSGVNAVSNTRSSEHCRTRVYLTPWDLLTSTSTGTCRIPVLCW